MAPSAGGGGEAFSAEPSTGGVRDVTQLDALVIALHHLEFAERNEGPHLARGPAARPHAAAVLEDEGVAGAAFHLRDDRQRAPAPARCPRPAGNIADRIADEGRRVV